jgi:hypothetical protein
LVAGIAVRRAFLLGADPVGELDVRRRDSEQGGALLWIADHFRLSYAGPGLISVLVATQH